MPGEKPELVLAALSIEELRKMSVRQICESQPLVVRAHVGLSQRFKSLLVGIEWEPKRHPLVQRTILEQALNRWVGVGWHAIVGNGARLPEPSPPRARYSVGLMPERTTPEGLKLYGVYDRLLSSGFAFLGSKENCRRECERLLEEDARTNADTAPGEPVAGERGESHEIGMFPTLPTTEHLRELTAREVIAEAAFPAGVFLHARVRKDEASRVLRVELWWHDDAPPEARDAITARVVEYLNVWVWDGWSVAVVTSTRPLPDVVWDMFARRFVPRKAYAPLGTPGQLKKQA